MVVVEGAGREEDCVGRGGVVERGRVERARVIQGRHQPGLLQLGRGRGASRLESRKPSDLGNYYCGAAEPSLASAKCEIWEIGGIRIGRIQYFIGHCRSWSVMAPGV